MNTILLPKLYLMKLKLPLHLCFGIIMCFLLQKNGIAQKEKQISSKKSIPIIIKDDGVEELLKGDVAMVFYITVTNTGIDPVHLFATSPKCCQKITKNDEDCESMSLQGGDMGKLYPRDNRNLTLLFVNLYPHDRDGSCDVEIKDANGALLTRKVRFNTILIRDSSVHIPRLLQRYYKLDQLSTCSSVDEDPLNQCQPYPCAIRYSGKRSYYNYTSRRCEKVSQCISRSDGTKTSAYTLEHNKCTVLVNAMTKEDFAEFHEGKPSAQMLTKAHSYPINVQCHNGKRDFTGRWCKCHTGWDSAPFDHKSFNMDVQVYHMCTVWLGKMSDEQARNITVLPKNRHYVTNVIIFTSLILIIIFVLALLIFLIYREKIFKKTSPYDDVVVEEAEQVALTETSQDLED